jgi:hypothetical protein
MSYTDRAFQSTASDHVSDELLEWAGWWAHFLGIQIKSARGFTC